MGKGRGAEMTTVFGRGMGEEWEKHCFSRVFHVDRILPMQTNRMRIGTDAPSMTQGTIIAHHRRRANRRCDLLQIVDPRDQGLGQYLRQKC